MVLFLSLNGMPLEAPEAEAIVAMLDMASGEMGEDEFTAWVREHARAVRAAAPCPGASASGGAGSANSNAGGW